MPSGTIKFFNDKKGYGFIKNDDDPENDVFVHMDDVEGGDLIENERVEFGIEEGPKGSRATNVKRLSDAE
jgi:CspA family cold shock protein|tara:strand:+ start:475 stop:684 length:210 start_codon:yes stop_codon:yes gene_type:complete